MKTDTPQRIHRQDYTPPPFLVDRVELDVEFLSGEVLVRSQLHLRRNPAVAPDQPLQLDGHGLETVAVTLERLAQGDRMVGVVTHVPALAERVPTRYVVRRDSQSSRVVREG